MKQLQKGKLGFLHFYRLFEKVWSKLFSQTRWRKIWTHQDALVHVAVLHIQADPDDAAVVHLLVVQRQRQSRVIWHRRHWAFVRAWGQQWRGAGDGGRGGAAGARSWTGAGARARGVQRRQGCTLPELKRPTDGDNRTVRIIFITHNYISYTLDWKWPCGFKGFYRNSVSQIRCNEDWIASWMYDSLHFMLDLYLD